MKGMIVAISELNGRVASALVEDGQLIDFVIAPMSEDEPIPGAIYRGVVGRALKGLNGVFVDLDGKKKGYLKLSKGLTPGSTILVQVTTASEDGKAPSVTQKIIFKSKFAHVTPFSPGVNISRKIKDEEVRGNLRIISEEVIGDNPDFGLILRSSCVDTDEHEITSDVENTWQLAHLVMQDLTGKPELLLDGIVPSDYAWRAWPGLKPSNIISGEHAFDNAGIYEQVEALSQPYIKLGEGASMYIEATKAMVTVDVNSIGGVSSAVNINMKAAQLLPKELRLRGLGGQIVIDFVPMPKNNRRKIDLVLAKAFKNDPIESSLVGWTQMGHFELQRKRERIQL